MTVVLPAPHELIGRQMLVRNQASAVFFEREAEPLARICSLMAERFIRGGRLLAFGAGHAVSDAQHIAVEFVHPVLVGKRALPALDLSAEYLERLRAMVRADDIVVGFAPPHDDARVDAALRDAMSHGALTLALPGSAGDYAVTAPSSDPFIHQELIEILYHTLWETVHVFFDREPLDQSAGAASFLYPFLGNARDSSERVIPEIAASIRSKATSVERLREQVGAGQAGAIADAVVAMHERITAGGTILCFGNGGSATDANDLALDLCASPKGYAPIPAVSLASDAATLTAIANDIGSDAIFARQLIAYGRPGDIAVAISTSGASSNIVTALAQARSQRLLSVALVGYDGGEVARRGLADHVIVVDTDQIPRVQEVHASIYHVMLDLLDALSSRA